MVTSTRRKDRSTSPQSSSSSSGSSSTSSSSSSSSSTSSSSDSSSDSDQSSAVSTRASSESEREGANVSTRRGPKTSASSAPRKNVPTNYQRKPTPPTKAPKGRNEQLQKHQSGQSISSRRSSHTSPKSSSKRDTHASDAEQKHKKNKKKSSLFSPENSSESEAELKKHSSQKFDSKASNKSASKSKDIRPKKSNSKANSSSRISEKHSSLRSSESGTNSNSATSGSESENTGGSTIFEKKRSSDSRALQRRRQSSERETEPVGREEAAENETGSRRFITRSSSGKSKRSSLLGITKGTDSESENGRADKKKKGSAFSSSSHKHGSKAFNGGLESSAADDSVMDSTSMHIESRIAARTNSIKVSSQRVKNEMLEASSIPAIELRNCPVDGCDSTGHLGGYYDRHFTVDACPVYHNLSKEQCKINREIRKKDMEERARSKSQFNARSPRNSSSTEQKNYCNKIRDSRDCMSEVNKEDEEEADSDRQPSLRGITPEWDLKLFQQAQAAACEKTEGEMRGLPDTKGIRYIQMGKYEMEAWYQSQYPEDYNQQPKIYVCEFCLKYMRSRTILSRHAAKCVWKHPPGDEIYRKDKLSVWEVDGTKYKIFCQNLCLLAMLFLDHKTLYYDVEPFLFYIMSIADSEGCHIIGYFSKEKNSFLNYNVSCIMTLPPYQRQGYGRLLIDFSYLLTKEEGKIGSPEKPLSDLGLISYRSYWKDLLLKALSNFNLKNVSIKDLSTDMAVNSYDIVSTFQAMGMMKYWKGKHILLKRQDLFEEFEERCKKRKFDQREIFGNSLDWTPYISIPQSDEQRSNSNNTTNNNNNNNNISTNNNISSSNGTTKSALEKKSSP